MYCNCNIVLLIDKMLCDKIILVLIRKSKKFLRKEKDKFYTYLVKIMRKTKNAFDKILSCLLALVMVLTLIPSTIFAENTEVDKNTEVFDISTYHFYDFSSQGTDEDYLSGPYNGSPYTPLWRYSEEYGESQGWAEGQTLEPYVFRTSTNEITYCLELGKASPSDTSMSYDENDLIEYNEGLMKVLEMGYPNKKGEDYGTTDAELEWATAVALKIVQGRLYTIDGKDVDSPLTLEAFEEGGILDKTFSRKYYNETQLSDEQIAAFDKKADAALALVTQLVGYSTDPDIEISKINLSKPEEPSRVNFFTGNFKAGPYKATTNIDGAKLIIDVEGLEDYTIVDENNNPLTDVAFGQDFYIIGDGRSFTNKEFKVTAYASDVKVLSQVFYGTNEMYIHESNGETFEQPYQHMYVAENVTLNDFVKDNILAPITYDVTFNKVDNDTNEAIDTATFVLMDLEGNTLVSPYLETSYSTENGTFTVKLPEGTYMYQEIVSPEGYIVNDDKIQFTVDAIEDDGENIVTVTNKKTEAVITKTDLVSGEAVPGATIEIKDSEGNPIPGSPFVTDKDGKISVEKLVPGTYTFKETIAPDGYILNEEECTFTIEADGTVTGTKTLTNKPTEAVITKTDLVTGEGVPGATIEIKDSEGNPITGSPFVTDKDGKITLSKLPVGTYTFKEIIAPAGYIINEEECTFTIEADGTVTGTKTLTNKPNNTVISKVDLVTGEAVPGATIEIKDSEGNPIPGSPFVTDENGEISISKLPAGTYTFKETIAPEGYILNEEECTFTIDEKGNVTGQTVLKNEPISVTFTKVDENTEKTLGGAEISLYKEDGSFVAKAETGLNGEVTFYVPAGKYFAVETKAPEGYSINNTKYEITVDEKGVVTGDTVITDKMISVVINKIDSTTTKPLADAKIEVFDSEGKSLGVFKTNKDGQIIFDMLAAGDYTFKEVEAPEGYIKSTETYMFTVNEDGTVSGTTTIANTPTKVTILKVDEDTDEALVGAVFEIRKGNTILGTQETNSKGELILTKLEAGTYKIKEIKAPDGYVLDSTVYEFTIKEDGTVTGTTKITNKTISVVLEKRDAETDELLKGAQFVVKDKDGKTVIDGLTNNEGKLVINKIAAGTYTLQEIAAPEGYKLNTSTYMFTVNEDGSVKGDTVIFNEKSDETTTETTEETTDSSTSTTQDDEKTQTGDDSKTNGMIPLMAGVVALIGFAIVSLKKKKL